MPNMWNALKFPNRFLYGYVSNRYTVQFNLLKPHGSFEVIVGLHTGNFGYLIPNKFHNYTTSNVLLTSIASLN